ncbi:MAG TPA: trypsin-like peptidase domain-containing protein [Pyrinomonadaceae bacterium]|nr:trypsin-like peptidase domain-containing protein [Pyrinomonadaceae bacterium]
MRRTLVALLAISVSTGALLFVPLNRGSIARAEVSEGERLAMYSKPAVVRLIVGPEGNFTYQDPRWPSARNLPYNYVVSGSGFFISPNGYIATNAHVTQMWHDGEDKAKNLLITRFILAVGKAFYSIDPNNMKQSEYDFIRSHSTLNSFNMYHLVVIPDGTAMPFEDKPSGYGAPTGESESAKDVAIVKIEVKNAPVLLFGDSDAVKVSDSDTVIGYPGVADMGEFKNILAPKAALEATFTYGHISANKPSASGATVLQTDANIDHGNSGGPVLNAKGQVIGLATFGKDSQHNFVVTSNTAQEFVKAVGVANELGLTDKLYREGLDLYWQDQFKDAKPKFEQVKRLFPQHSEIDRLLQTSEQAIIDGKDKSGFGMGWLVGGVLVVLFLIIAVIIIAVVVFLLLRRRGKGQPGKAAGPSTKPTAGPTPPTQKPEPAKATPPPTHSPTPASAPPPIVPIVAPGMHDRTVDLSATVAIVRPSDTAPISYGSIKFVSGILTGQTFDVKPEGVCVGRDSNLAQIVIADPRISKRHVWVGVRDGKVAVTDQGSRNGTFLNDPKSERITDVTLSPGDTVILGESDVARFEYQK